MKTLKENTRGQFTIIAALLISILTLSLVLSIHQTNLHRQQLRYEPVEELVLGITSDLDRCLTHALSIATQRYHDNKSLGTVYATDEGYNFISKWVRSVLASYAHLGVKMAMSVPENETAGGPTDIGWSIDWAHPRGVSQVFTKFDLDIDAYGFKGWVGRSAKFVRLEILPQSIELDNQSTTLKFKILQGKLSDTLPIPNLTPESLNKSKVYIPKLTSSPIPTNITNLSYLGSGTYTVTFELTLPSYLSNLINKHIVEVELTVVTPEDDIIVSAYLPASDVSVTLDSREENNASEHLGSIRLGDVTYTVLPNSTSTIGKYGILYTPENASYAFLNWTTTGNITVENPYSNTPPTYVTIYGDGNITAFYTRYIPPEPTIVNLTLDSRDWENLNNSLGSINLDSKSYAPLPAIATNMTLGEYMLQYIPYNASYVFLWWESSGGVIPANSTANPTILIVNGNGNVTAVYKFQPQIPTPATVNLQSWEESSPVPTNNGTIQLGTTVFSLPNSTSVTSGAYLLVYTPFEGYVFLNWTTTANITVQDPNSSTTTVTVGGDGDITAFYRQRVPPQPQTFELVMHSREEGNLTFSDLGTIIFDSTLYSLWNSTNVTAGDYTLEYQPPPDLNYFFVRWERQGDITPWNFSGNPTTLTVFGDGNITAVYSSLPPVTELLNVTLQSQEVNSPVPTNNGTIQLGTTVFSLPNSTSVVNGTYLLSYTPAKGYTFLYWSTTGDIIVDSNSSTTTVTINSDGNITAFYRGYSVFLRSRFWANSTLTNIGNITLGTETYTLPYTVTGLAGGDYLLQYIPENSSYIFLWWEFAGGAIPLNSSANPTTLKLIGDGSITAVYDFKPPTPAPVTVDLQSLRQTTDIPPDLGKIQLGETIFEPLPSSTTVLTGTYFLEYTPATGYVFVGWNTTAGIVVQDPNSPATTVTINSNGTITAIYRGFEVFLSSRHWESSSYNLGNITLGTTTYTLPNTTHLAQGDYFLQYIPYNSSYVFLWWEPSGNVWPWNWTSNTTSLMVYGDGTITAVYSLGYVSPPSFPGEWGTLYLALLPPDKSMLLPYSMLPGQYFNPRSSTLPIPPRPYWQYINVSSPAVPVDITLAKYVNTTLYIQLASGKAENITIQLSFTYNNVTHLLGSRTFYNLVGEGWYTHTIDTDMISKVDWPVPGEPIVPAGSVITLTAIVPPNSGTLHIIYGWDNYQSRIELF